ncbi:Lon protease [Stieleria neptunia]|uniref:Lon protease n=1 Tax=Stieleria neptunia TaxID=2527979 RepID=A0A518HQQ5_9BACT|nr:LON peptidase substrate-binding domain-containing protein [Stieleria neptunia]QDV43131.1 Lon protease [Stieleria neptunia]
MGDLDDLTRLPDDFDGQVRLFPLPSLVLFPHAMQPLHIFEPRYCEMLAEALESDELIAMATLTETQPTDKGDPPIDPTVCIGKIVSHVERDDDRHNILLVGIKRAQVTAEVDAGRCFRIAKINVLDDLYPPSGMSDRSQLRADLLAAFGEVIPASQSVQQGLSELLAGSMGLGPITDIISHTLPLSVAMKLRLLAEQNVDDRAQLLIDFLASGAVQLPSADHQSGGGAAKSRLPFPPPFSTN